MRHLQDDVNPHLSWLIARDGLWMQVALMCSAVHRVLMVLALPALPVTSLWSQRVPIVAQPRTDNAKRAEATTAKGPKRPAQGEGGGGRGRALDCRRPSSMPGLLVARVALTDVVVRRAHLFLVVAGNDYHCC